MHSGQRSDFFQIHTALKFRTRKQYEFPFVRQSNCVLIPGRDRDPRLWFFIQLVPTVQTDCADILKCQPGRVVCLRVIISSSYKSY